MALNKNKLSEQCFNLVDIWINTLVFSAYIFVLIECKLQPLLKFWECKFVVPPSIFEGDGAFGAATIYINPSRVVERNSVKAKQQVVLRWRTFKQVFWPLPPNTLAGRATSGAWLPNVQQLFVVGMPSIALWVFLMLLSSFENCG